jgi:8-oxo-dGTP pyrophosphatase MutT (NUDIX family)
LKLGEDAIAAALREAHEEAGVPEENIRVVETTTLDLGFWSYTTVVGISEDYFDPDESDAESAALEWVALDEVGTRDLHPAFGASWPDLHERLLRAR